MRFHGDSLFGSRLASVSLRYGSLALAVSLAALAFWADARPGLRPWPVLALWAGSVTAFAVAAALLRPPRIRETLRPHWGALASVSLLIVVALVVRVVALDRIPENLSGDEAGLGTFAREAVGGAWDDPFTTGWFSHPALWFYLQALSFEVFGDGVVGLRLLSALIGTATVGALYVFTRRWYGPRVALAAAALLAVYHFHVHFSRIGLNQGVDALCALVAFGFLLAAWESRSPLLFAASGLAVGIAQNLYYGTRLEVVVVIGFLGHQLLVSHDRVFALARYLPLTALGFLIGWGPGVRVPLYQWDDYSARLAYVGLFRSGWFDAHRDLGESTLGIFWRQIRDSAGAITTVADRGPHYVSGMPLLDTVSSVLFLLGLAVLVHRWRRPESGILLAWLVGALAFGGVLLVNPPEVQRFVTIAPVLCLVVALGLDGIVSVTARALTDAKWLVPATTALVVAALAAWNLNFYFREYTPRRSAGMEPTETATEIGRFIATRPQSYVYFVGEPFKYLRDPTILFLVPEIAGVDVPEGSGAEPLPPPPDGRDPLVVFYPPRDGEAAALVRRYAGTRLRRFHSEVDGRLLFAVYEPSPAGWR